MRLAVQKLDRVHPPQEAYCPPEHFGGPLGPMANLVVATKLHVPRLRPDIVHRQRLLE
jgi:hypothetical protein